MSADGRLPQRGRQQGNSHRRELTRYSRAQWWLGQGVDLVPLRAKTKYLIKGFGAHSKHITTPRQVWFWFERLRCNVGVVCGGCRGLVCADFDDEAAFTTWRSGPGKDFATLMERSFRGFHVFFFASGIPNAYAPGVELKAKGVVAVAPSVHPTGCLYEIVADIPIAILDRAQVAALFPFISDALLIPSPKQQPATPRRDGPASGDDVISRIKAALPVSAEATRLTALKGKGGHYVGLCPFHDDHEPSFWVDDEAGLWGCYSPSCTTNAGGQKAHDVINLRAMWKGVSVQDAIRQLAYEVLSRRE